MTDAVYYFRRSAGAPVSVTTGASPFTYQNTSLGVQLVTVAGGATTLIELDQGAGFFPAIGIAGTYTVFPNQSIRASYVVSAPTITTVQL